MNFYSRSRLVTVCVMCCVAVIGCRAGAAPDTATTRRMTRDCQSRVKSLIAHANASTRLNLTRSYAFVIVTHIGQRIEGVAQGGCSNGIHLSIAPAKMRNALIVIKQVASAKAGTAAVLLQAKRRGSVTLIVRRGRNEINEIPVAVRSSANASRFSHRR